MTPEEIDSLMLNVEPDVDGYITEMQFVDFLASAQQSDGSQKASQHGPVSQHGLR